jgi:hypothetical protein
MLFELWDERGEDAYTDLSKIFLRADMLRLLYTRTIGDSTGERQVHQSKTRGCQSNDADT